MVGASEPSLAASRMPASAASAAPATQVNTATRSTEMPSSRADSPFSAAARMATPKRVNLKNAASASATSGHDEDDLEVAAGEVHVAELDDVCGSPVGMMRSVSACSWLRENRIVTRPTRALADGERGHERDEPGRVAQPAEQRALEHAAVQADEHRS